MKFRKREKRKTLKSYLVSGTDHLWYHVVDTDQIRIVSTALGYAGCHTSGPGRHRPLTFGTTRTEGRYGYWLEPALHIVSYHNFGL
jgi:hypothetical protein